MSDTATHSTDREELLNETRISMINDVDNHEGRTKGLIDALQRYANFMQKQKHTDRYAVCKISYTRRLGNTPTKQASK
jgi:hypothetical protein